MPESFLSTDRIPDASLDTFLAETAAEAIGWHPLGEGAYLHLGSTERENWVIHVVGVPDVSMLDMNVLLID